MWNEIPPWAAWVTAYFAIAGVILHIYILALFIWVWVMR
jgi:hypothetical protein